jgi:hypothetical protein
LAPLDELLAALDLALDCNTLISLADITQKIHGATLGGTTGEIRSIMRSDVAWSTTASGPKIAMLRVTLAAVIGVGG